MQNSFSLEIEDLKKFKSCLEAVKFAKKADRHS